MRVFLSFEHGKQRAGRIITLPKGLSPVIGMIIQDDCDHDFKVKDIIFVLSSKPRQIVLELDYIPYEGEPEANFDIMASSGWSIFKPKK